MRSLIFYGCVLFYSEGCNNVLLCGPNYNLLSDIFGQLCKCFSNREALILSGGAEVNRWALYPGTSEESMPDNGHSEDGGNCPVDIHETERQTG